MNRWIALTAAFVAAVWLFGIVWATEEPAGSTASPRATAGAPVYGEWLIRVKPDKGPEYNRLIEEKGLLLFLKAGGRMVGWWNTLIGDLYEHLTIWRFDDMAAFEKAVAVLQGDDRFAAFAALRDPLLDGEESRFLKLTSRAQAPNVPEPARFVVHEIHRVLLSQREAYIRFMEEEGLALLRKHGFRPAGPWVVDVGRWSEVTYLFPFDSLAERSRLIARFSATDDGASYGRRIHDHVEDITTRMLVPAGFSGKASREP